MPAARNLLMAKYGQRACEILTDVFTGQTILSQDLKKKALKKLKIWQKTSEILKMFFGHRHKNQEKEEEIIPNEGIVKKSKLFWVCE